MFAPKRLLGLLFSATCFAAPGISDVRAVCLTPGTTNATINVYFEIPAPSPADAAQNGNWLVRYFYKSGPAPFTAPIGPVTISALKDSGRVDIQMIGMIPTGATSVLVQYGGSDAGSSWRATLPCDFYTKKPEKYKAATGKDDSDIYLAGGFSPATATTPTYSLDANLGVRFQHRASNSWQLVGTAKTDNRKVADPDSFRGRAAWVHDSPNGLATSFNLGGGMEFDRQGRARNVVASPRISFVPAAGVRLKDGKLVAAAALEIRAGFETGRNTTSTFRFKNVNFTGTEGIVRGVPGATLYLNFFDPTLLGLKFKKISLVSNYDVRLLGRPEIFLETRGTGPDPIPQIRSQPRNHTDTSIAFKLTDAVGLSIKYEHGSLPPAFVYVRNKLTFGIVLQLKESRGLRI